MPQGAYFVHQNPQQESVFYLSANDKRNVSQYKIMYRDGTFQLGEQKYPHLGKVVETACQRGLTGPAGQFRLTEPVASRLRSAQSQSQSAAASGEPNGGILHARSSAASSTSAVAMQATLANTSRALPASSSQRPSLADVSSDGSDLRAGRGRNAKDRFKGIGAKMGATFASVRLKLVKERPTAASVVATTPPLLEPSVNQRGLHSHARAHEPLLTPPPPETAHLIRSADSSRHAHTQPADSVLYAQAQATEASRGAKEDIRGGGRTPRISVSVDEQGPPTAPRPPLGKKGDATLSSPAMVLPVSQRRHDSMGMLHAAEEEAAELAEVCIALMWCVLLCACVCVTFLCVFLCMSLCISVLLCLFLRLSVP